MKKIFGYTAILFAFLLFSSCLKENHVVRFKNDYAFGMENVVIGSAQIGNVASMTTSPYKSINTGNFTISGSSSMGQPLTGSGSISGRGKHKWTVTLSSAGQVSIAEDK